MTDRALARVARRHAARTGAQIADRPTGTFIATVATVTPVEGGNPAVTVSWRGQDLAVNAVGSTYTPSAGDRVLCHLVDNQVVVADRLLA